MITRRSDMVEETWPRTRHEGTGRCRPGWVSRSVYVTLTRNYPASTASRHQQSLKRQVPLGISSLPSLVRQSTASVEENDDVESRMTDDIVFKGKTPTRDTFKPNPKAPAWAPSRFSDDKKTAATPSRTGTKSSVRKNLEGWDFPTVEDWLVHDQSQFHIGF